MRNQICQVIKEISYARVSTCYFSKGDLNFAEFFPSFSDDFEILIHIPKFWAILC